MAVNMLSFLCLTVFFSLFEDIHSAAEGGHQMTSHSFVSSFVAGIHSTKPHDRLKRATSGSRLTYEERLDFLNTHNAYRRNVDPEASDMQFMVWHEELASMAQEWADRCEWVHGNPERYPKPFSYIGQNLHASTAQTVNGSDSVSSWHSEVLYYTYFNNSCETNKVCGHYTQVVWAKSNFLGCATSVCTELFGTSMKAATFSVCNYGPGGNVAGEKPYTEGLKCTTCPAGMICDWKLCASEPKCGSKSCENGGTLDVESCECQCPEFYDGATCSLGSDGDGDRTAGQGHSVTQLARFSVLLTALINITIYKTY